MVFAPVNSSKNVSENTAKIYKSCLNRLARETPFRTVEDLVNHYPTIISWVKLATASEMDESKRKYKRRVLYCAIFWALHGSDFTQQPDNPYRKAFHDEDPISTSEGRPWRKSYALRDD